MYVNIYIYIYIYIFIYIYIYVYVEKERRKVDDKVQRELCIQRPLSDVSFQIFC